MADLLCQRSFFCCKYNTLSVRNDDGDNHQSSLMEFIVLPITIQYLVQYCTTDCIVGTFYCTAMLVYSSGGLH